MKLSLGYITCPTKAEAKKIVIALLEDGLITCANIIDGAESYFVWEREIQKAKESIIILKTRSKNENKIIRVVKDMHSYHCPCIAFFSMSHGNKNFMKWIASHC